MGFNRGQIEAIALLNGKQEEEVRIGVYWTTVPLPFEATSTEETLSGVQGVEPAGVQASKAMKSHGLTRASSYWSATPG